MYVSSQALDFLEFVFIGVVIGIVFDFFRGYRKANKTNEKLVLFQDVIFFIIVTMIIVFSIINLLDSQIRLYIFLGLILGCSIYFSTLSKYVVRLYSLIINILKEIINGMFLPINLHIQIFQKITKKMKKIWKKCCKLFVVMISYIYKLLKKIGLKITSKFKKKKMKNKRGFKFMRKKEKSSSKKLNKRKFGFTHIVIIAFALYFVYTLVEQQIQINKYDSQIKMYTADIENKSNLVQYYNNQKGNTNSDEYIENVARESLGYVKPYEKIFVDANK